LPASELDLLIHAAKAAAEVALRIARDGFKIYRKKDGSSLTDGDLAVDRVLKEILLGARPDFGWFSEEGDDLASRHKNRKCWIVDPIDGTSDFIQKGSNWCIGAALLDGRDVTASILIQPKTGTLFSAAKGQGSYRNGERLRLESDALPLRVMCSKTDAAQMRSIQRVPRENQPFLLRLAKLAAGDMSAVVASTPKSDWDLAPATLLVTEAGGQVSDFRGGPLQFNAETGKQDGIIAASASAYAVVTHLLEKT
jgi:myo-inositol-1(or 4)-monophosphatase